LLCTIKVKTNRLNLKQKNKQTMRTTITFILIITSTLIFAQKKQALTAFTEFSIGVNNTGFSSKSNIESRNDNAWQAGISRRHQLTQRFDLSYGAALVAAKHQAIFEETTVAFVDKGMRGYSHTYFRVPLEVSFKPIVNKSFFVSGGFNMSTDVHNVSQESFVRTQYVDDSGYRYERPTEKSIRQFRETGTLDLGVRVGAGARVNFNKMVISVSAAYNQGLVTKDMGLKQHAFEFQISTTMPRFGRTSKGHSTNAGNWMN
jgi:hypothetical protein